MISGIDARALIDGVEFGDFSGWSPCDGGACLPLEDGFALRFDTDTGEFRLTREGNIHCSLGDREGDPVISGRTVIFGGPSSGVRIRMEGFDPQEYIASEADRHSEDDDIVGPLGPVRETPCADVQEEHSEAVRLASLFLAGDAEVLGEGAEMCPARGLRFSFGGGLEHGQSYPRDCFCSYESPKGGVQVWLCGYAFSDGEAVGVESRDDILTFTFSAGVLDIVDGIYPPEMHDTAVYADSVDTTDYRGMLDGRSEEFRERMLALCAGRDDGWV